MSLFCGWPSQSAQGVTFSEPFQLTTSLFVIPVEVKQITNQIEMGVGLLVDSQSNVHKTCSCGLATMNFI